MKNLKEFRHNQKATQYENELHEKPHIRALNSPVEIRVPIFHWNFGGSKKDMKTSCTSLGCVVKSYRKIGNPFKIGKRTSNTLGKSNHGINDEIRQANSELQLTIPIQYNLVKILVSLISLS